MTHDSKTLAHADLHHFTGTENWYRHPFVRQVLYTDGAQYVAEKGGAYWLLDEIAFAQKGNPRVAAEPFQVWKLQVKPDQTATLSCENGNGTPVTAKQLDYTDFPLAEITFYFTNNVILLPSEY
jgi:hypothetical protein